MPLVNNEPPAAAQRDNFMSTVKPPRSAMLGTSQSAVNFNSSVSVSHKLRPGMNTHETTFYKPKRKESLPFLSKNKKRLTRTQSDMARPSFKDPEEMAHNIICLKQETNSIVQDNLKLRTRNKNMESVVESLYEDLAQYQQEIQRIYAGQGMSQNMFHSTIVQGLKRQVRDERMQTKSLHEEVDQLKRGLKAT